MSGKAPPLPKMTISGLTEGGLSGKIMTPINDFPRLCRTLRPAPQAGCFVSRLKLSKDSAQITLRPIEHDGCFDPFCQSMAWLLSPKTLLTTCLPFRAQCTHVRTCGPEHVNPYVST